MKIQSLLRCFVMTSCLLLLALWAAPGVWADNLPRDYIPGPMGKKLMVFYDYHVSAHKTYSEGNTVTKDASISGDIYIFRPVYYHNYGPFAGASQVLFFAKDVQIDGVGQISGLSDMLYSPTVWFVDNAASKSWLGFIPHISIPIGEYDKNRAALSPGENRWKIQPELNYTQGFGPGAYIELTGAAQFFQKNDDYYNTELEQDPLYTVEVHLTYDLAPTLWVGASYFWHVGGETEVGGVAQNDEQNNHTLGLTFAYGLAPANQLLVSYQNDVEVEAGPRYQTFALRFCHLF